MTAIQDINRRLDATEKRAHAAAGAGDAEGEERHLLAVLALEDEIATAPAATLADVRAKLRVAAQILNEQEDAGKELTAVRTALEALDQLEH